MAVTHSLSILEALHDRAVERELRQNATQNKEKTEWEYFWKIQGQQLMLYASSCGSLDSVKVLVKTTKSTLGYLPKRYYRIFALLSAFPTGRKPALYSEVRLIARCT